MGKEQAVKNPLARTIVDAVAQLGLNVVFEATKMHPKDWANPGRIKIELKGEDGKLKRGNVKNSSSSPIDSPTLEPMPNEIFQLRRTSSLPPRIFISQITPYDCVNAHGISHSRDAPARRASTTAGSTARLEDERDITIT